MNIKPVGDRVLIQPVKEEEMTKSGIVLPATADKEHKAEGTVAAIGNGAKVSALGLQIGNKVIFGKYAGEEVKVGEQEYKILSHEDVLAVVE